MQVIFTAKVIACKLSIYNASIPRIHPVPHLRLGPVLHASGAGSGHADDWFHAEPAGCVSAGGTEEEDFYWYEGEWGCEGV